jgi:hypothetical protein
MLPAAGKIIATLSAVQEAQHIGGNVAEIGVHHGKLFILLYLLTRGEERAVAVDLFANQVQNIDHSGVGDLDKFRANLARHADADMRRLVVHEGDSTALDGLALKRLAGGAYRLISIGAITSMRCGPASRRAFIVTFTDRMASCRLRRGPTKCFSAHQALSRFTSIRCAPLQQRRLNTTFLVLAFSAATLLIALHRAHRQGQQVVRSEGPRPD